MARKASTARKMGVQISIDLALLERLDRSAECAGLSRSEFVRRLISDHIDEAPGPASPDGVEVISVAGREFCADIERDGRWWIGSVRELPGCGSQGRTRTELREMLADAIEGYLIVRGDIKDDGRR